MRGFVVLTVLMFLAAPSTADPDRAAPVTVPEPLRPFLTAQAFDCRDVSCKRLRSCAEACYKFLQCGQSKRDGDNDGIPCENLCSQPC